MLWAWLLFAIHQLVKAEFIAILYRNHSDLIRWLYFYKNLIRNYKNPPPGFENCFMWSMGKVLRNLFVVCFEFTWLLIISVLGIPSSHFLVSKLSLPSINCLPYSISSSYCKNMEDHINLRCPKCTKSFAQSKFNTLKLQDITALITTA